MAWRPSNTEGPQRGGESPGELFRYGGLGIELVCIVGLFVALGWHLDRRWGTSPWLAVAGLAAGFAAGMGRLVRVLLIRQGRGRGRGRGRGGPEEGK